MSWSKVWHHRFMGVEVRSMQWTVWDNERQVHESVWSDAYQTVQTIAEKSDNFSWPILFEFQTTAADNIFWHVSFSRCPIDGEIMGQFQYNPSKTTAFVHFQAHKFPYTASVYYQCNVRLCIKADHGCDDVVSLFHPYQLPMEVDLKEFSKSPEDFTYILFLILAFLPWNFS